MAGWGALTGVGLAELRLHWKMWASNESAKKAANGTHLAIRIGNLTELELSRFHSPRGGKRKNRFLKRKKKGFAAQHPFFLRVPRGFNWRALDFFYGSRMSKTGSSRSVTYSSMRTQMRRPG